jgi:hypothetical protein
MLVVVLEKNVKASKLFEIVRHIADNDEHGDQWHRNQQSGVLPQQCRTCPELKSDHL